MTTLCDQCGRIAYTDEQRHCDLCGDIICSRRACTKNHLRPVTLIPTGQQVPQCTAGGIGTRRLKALAKAMAEARK